MLEHTGVPAAFRQKAEAVLNRIGVGGTRKFVDERLYEKVNAEASTLRQYENGRSGSPLALSTVTLGILYMGAASFRCMTEPYKTVPGQRFTV